MEFVEVNVQGTVEAQARSDRADNLSDETVEVVITRTRNIKMTVADVVDSFVVNEKSAVRVFNGAVGGENSVVWFNDSS